jgi:hypothetical protein
MDLNLREEHVVQVSENKGLRKIFQPKKDELGNGSPSLLMILSLSIIHLQ